MLTHASRLFHTPGPHRSLSSAGSALFVPLLLFLLKELNSQVKAGGLLNIDVDCRPHSVMFVADPGTNKTRLRISDSPAVSVLALFFPKKNGFFFPQTNYHLAESIREYEEGFLNNCLPVDWIRFLLTLRVVWTLVLIKVVRLLSLVLSEWNESLKYSYLTDVQSQTTSAKMWEISGELEEERNWHFSLKKNTVICIFLFKSVNIQKASLFVLNHPILPQTSPNS